MPVHPPFPETSSPELVTRLSRLPEGHLLTWARGRRDQNTLAAQLSEARNDPTRQVELAADWLKGQEDLQSLLEDLDRTIPQSSRSTPSPTPARIAPVAQLGELLEAQFDTGELEIWLSSFPWGSRLVRDLTRPSSRSQAAHEAAQKIVERGHATPALFASWEGVRPGRREEIRAVAGHFAVAQPASDEPPPTSSEAPATGQALWWSVAFLFASMGVLFLVWGGPPSPGPLAPPPPSSALRLPPAPTQPLNLALVYLDPPVAGASEPVRALESALADVLAGAPRAVLLIPALSEGPSIQPLLEVLAARAPDGPPVLALLPDVEGEPVLPVAAGEARSYHAALPVCAASGRACVDLLLLSPFDTAIAAWTSSEEGTSRPRADRPLDRLARCDGTAPFASLALALLARDGRAALAEGGLPLESACTVGAVRALRAPPTDPCARPWGWLWASELRGSRRPADPLGDGAAVNCPVRESLRAPGGLRDRIVVLADSLPPGRLLSPTLILQDDAGQTVTLHHTQAEALAVLAYNTLGWLEEK